MSFLARAFAPLATRSVVRTLQLTSLPHRLGSTGTSEQQKYEYLLVDVKGQHSNVALVQLNRPKAFNALCNGLMEEVFSHFPSERIEQRRSFLVEHRVGVAR
jgi:hypothetical protein